MTGQTKIIPAQAAEEMQQSQTPKPSSSTFVKNCALEYTLVRKNRFYQVGGCGEIDREDTAND
jgi:hypothetical protein